MSTLSSTLFVPGETWTSSGWLVDSLYYLTPRSFQERKLTPKDFPLPTLGPVLLDIAKEVHWGRGFALIKGLPVEQYSPLEYVLATWGIGVYWGNPVRQNKKGHLLGHVKVRHEGSRTGRILSGGAGLEVSRALGHLGHLLGQGYIPMRVTRYSGQAAGGNRYVLGG